MNRLIIAIIVIVAISLITINNVIAVENLKIYAATVSAIEEGRLDGMVPVQILNVAKELNPKSVSSIDFDDHRVHILKNRGIVIFKTVFYAPWDTEEEADFYIDENDAEALINYVIKIRRHGIIFIKITKNYNIAILNNSLLLENDDFKFIIINYKLEKELYKANLNIGVELEALINFAGKDGVLTRRDVRYWFWDEIDKIDKIVNSANQLNGYIKFVNNKFKLMALPN
jgi:hypothetical protein